MKENNTEEEAEILRELGETMQETKIRRGRDKNPAAKWPEGKEVKSAQGLRKQDKREARREESKKARTARNYPAQTKGAPVKEK